jgi:hypothetical protein
LQDPKRFTETASGSRVSFNRSEIEWLLQVLNDVRVGCWLELGSPAEPVEIKPEMDPQTIRQLLVMDAAGFFEMNFLHAASRASSSGHD